MHKTLRSLFFVSLFILPMLQQSCVPAYRHPATGLVLPDELATLKKTDKIHSYEEEYPGYGISIDYNGPSILATVYIYKTEKNTISVNLNDLDLIYHFGACAEAIKIDKGRGSSDVTKISEGEIAWDDTDTPVRSLEASFSYTQNSQEKLSHLYLLSAKNHFIKVRFTYDQKTQETSETVRNNFLKEFGSILRNMDERISIKPDMKKAFLKGKQGKILLQKDISASVMPAWLSYALIRAEWVEKKYYETHPGATYYQHSFEEEWEARGRLLHMWRYLKQINQGCSDQYLDELLKIQEEGFLYEYVWLCFRSPEWNEPSYSLRIIDLIEWMRKNLASHKPETHAWLEPIGQ